MGIAGMILGILAIIFVWIPIVGVIAWPLIIIGLPLSAIGFAQNRKRGEGSGMAIAGIVMNIIALVIAILWTVFFAVAVTST
ncbi:MAG: hypothetical protein OXG46_11845 [Chloroflexi bacterium]|nr:hypothetical protein [Chloroflexota bacterium]MCY3938199.1 hypothetical protein [Chloroflexota bacterium]